MSEKPVVGKDIRTVFEIGRSLAVTIPMEYVKAHQMKKGDKLEVFYNEALHMERPQKGEIEKKTHR